jgi:hypothetical protein
MKKCSTVQAEGHVLLCISQLRASSYHVLGNSMRRMSVLHGMTKLTLSKYLSHTPGKIQQLVEHNDVLARWVPAHRLGLVLRPPMPMAHNHTGQS